MLASYKLSNAPNYDLLEVSTAKGENGSICIVGNSNFRVLRYVDGSIKALPLSKVDTRVNLFIKGRKYPAIVGSGKTVWQLERKMGEF